MGCGGRGSRVPRGMIPTPLHFIREISYLEKGDTVGVALVGSLTLELRTISSYVSGPSPTHIARYPLREKVIICHKELQVSPQGGGGHSHTLGTTTPDQG